MNRWTRALRHLLGGPWSLRRCLSRDDLARIEKAIRACESRHPGEIRFAVEAALPFDDALRGVTPRERAIQVFSELRVWDTEHNNGVLIYLLLADRDVEIVADRGVANSRVPAGEWERCCQLMEAHFREARFCQGVIAGIEAVAEVLARYPGARPDAGNELPDAPVVL